MFKQRQRKKSTNENNNKMKNLIILVLCLLMSSCINRNTLDRQKVMLKENFPKYHVLLATNTGENRAFLVEQGKSFYQINMCTDCKEPVIQSIKILK